MINNINKDSNSMRVLAAARRAWTGAADLRTRRLRYKRFTYGDQWSDLTTDDEGNTVTEGVLAEKKGKKPMTNNLIRRLVKCIVGRYRMLAEEESLAGKEIMSENGGAMSKSRDKSLASIRELNHLDELDARALEEFLISGCAIQRVTAERRGSRDGVWVDNVNPSRFFVNATSDPRGWDIELVGMLHEMSVAEAVMRFSAGSRRRAMAIRELYAQLEDDTSASMLGARDRRMASFDRATDGRCRVIEVWTLEAGERLRCHDRLNGTMSLRSVADSGAIEAENCRREKSGEPAIDVRWEMATVWHCRWLAPDGTVLDEYDSPYAHGSHPFAVKLYPLTDGEIHSLVEDVIDQQLYVNRLITLIDHVIGTSAKGALLFPVEQKTDTMRWEDVAQAWSAPDGVIPVRGLPGMMEPRQVSSNSTDIGARELLTLEMKMFEDVSGVSNALMGRSSSGGNVGVARYESEVKNATIAINDLLKAFDFFRRQRDRKAIESL